MKFLFFRFLALTAVLFLQAQNGDAPNAFPVPAADHHVHLLSPGLVQDWKSLGVPFSRPDTFYSSPSPLLDTAVVSKAIILSMAYLYGSEWFRGLDTSRLNEEERVRRENTFIAATAQRHSSRLAAFSSVHPMRPYALDEIRRCRTELGVAGVKLHLANSDIDLTKEEHKNRLTKIFSMAQSLKFPLFLHIQAVEGDSAVLQAEILIREILFRFPDVEVIIAHLGGSGGYGRRVERVVRKFIEHLRPGGLLQHHSVYLELSAVVLTEPSEGVDPPSEESLLRLSVDVRKVGLERILFGSDHPVFHTNDYARTLRRKLSLTDDEFRIIFANQSSVLRQLP